MHIFCCLLEQHKLRAQRIGGRPRRAHPVCACDPATIVRRRRACAGRRTYLAVHGIVVIRLTARYEPAHMFIIRQNAESAKSAGTEKV